MSTLWMFWILSFYFLSNKSQICDRRKRLSCLLTTCVTFFSVPNSIYFSHSFVYLCILNKMIFNCIQGFDLGFTTIVLKFFLSHSTISETLKLPFHWNFLRTFLESFLIIFLRSSFSRSNWWECAKAFNVNINRSFYNFNISFTSNEKHNFCQCWIIAIPEVFTRT